MKLPQILIGVLLLGGSRFAWSLHKTQQDRVVKQTEHDAEYGSAETAITEARNQVHHQFLRPGTLLEFGEEKAAPAKPDTDGKPTGFWSVTGKVRVSDIDLGNGNEWPYEVDIQCQPGEGWVPLSVIVDGKVKYWRQ
jgi:hypothetical protein